jgi:hypothetical protein
MMEWIPHDALTFVRRVTGVFAPSCRPHTLCPVFLIFDFWFHAGFFNREEQA